MIIVLITLKLNDNNNLGIESVSDKVYYDALVNNRVNID